ncbi:putative AbiEii toxin of type IV toxin-antitoxin system [Desulfobotulus alkaliphilus]|uniref:Putative AbiEii toxin of type IV toxin-antitoxin system n=1 Tax=Desulfobotulus alkaliphilus TaxID=622671 RepID=A0A562RY44_9BACT|nr:AAA family ATPase [Desulfobotulus alkaliphilus]TWI73965.1 putative AbiEii toxin of type IV toxin-antitoxin system [Desulfobotulus alkaliphilus]
MTKNQKIPVKIRRISIRNYKGIDTLEMDFPAPRMPDDPDILIMGSQNGLGKSSIIECCALLLLSLTQREERFKLRDRYTIVNVPDLLIKSGCHFAEISGDIVIGDETSTVHVRIDRNGVIKISGEILREKIIENELFNSETEVEDFIKAICGFTPNPVMENKFLLFHSYRKVQEGNPELGMMVEGRSPKRPPFQRYETPMSTFKLRILRSLMGQANLFELGDDEDPAETIEKLNELVRFYAHGTISKLRPSPDNTVDFRIKPVNGEGSFTFDGLSSGQKEIISTLFLVWYHTRNNPSVIFIDEPELHLNAQWHRSFVKMLLQMSPQNQYIMATHSEDIMDSVSEDRRVLLLGKDEGEL